MRGKALQVVGIALLVVLAGCSASSGGGGASNYGGSGGGGAAASGDGGSGNVGLSAGGAQDANAFRSNVREGFVPRPRAISHAGLYHDYYFDTGQSQTCESMFCPSYGRAVTADPLSGEREEYLSVGLNSGLSQADFERPDLNVVVVLDTSGSMRERFDQYYYDGGQRHEVTENAAKMDAARDAVATLTRHLEEGDQLGVVTFSDEARTVQPLRSVGEMDVDSVRRRVDSVGAGGGTNLQAGMVRAQQMVAEHAGQDDEETRIVYVTDAMPNQGATGVGSLRRQLDADADRGIHTTFAGVGVDFNTELVDAISDVRGANYYAVHSPAQFSERMGEGFDYMVTPLVYDFSLEVQSDAYRIEHVYGAPGGADSGQLMQVTTLFPSRREGNRTEGGVILLELERTGEETDGSVTLSANYETRDGQHHETTRRVSFRGRDAPYYEHSGVRKAVVLTRYANLVRNWVNYEQGTVAGASPAEPADGIEHVTVGQWERGSVQLRVSPPYDRRVRQFRQYFRSEMTALGDDSMQRDLAVLDRLVAGSGEVTARESDADEQARIDHDEGESVRAPDSDSAGGVALPSPGVVDVAGLFATVVIGLYGAKKRNRGL